MVAESKARPCDFVLFGTKGDLARRKLLPALYQLEKADLIHPDTRIVGVARYEYTLNDYVELVEDALDTFVKEGIDQKVWNRFKARLDYCMVNMREAEDYKKLAAHVDLENRVMVNYMSTPPSIFGDICEGLFTAGLINDETRVVLEKPIGHDLASSAVINDQVAKYFKEEQTYRIDHYLGKETVLNLLALRFANAIFTSNWDNKSIDHVQITVAEEVGIEGRWGYFDDAGQMRDMVQNHLLQVLSLVAMNPPVSLHADDVRHEKVRVIKCLRPITAENVEEKTVRGQYVAGQMNGQDVPGYLEEDGANTESSTESFVALRCDIDNWRWAGVPFYLRTGKRMPSKLTEIVVHFKSLPHNIFNEEYERVPDNKLIIRLQPHEGVEVHVMNKVPGLDESMKLQKTKLDLSFSETFSHARIADAYERLLLEALLGNQSLFVRRDEVEAAWKYVDGIFAAWDKVGDKPQPYAAGSWGPDASFDLLSKDGRQWDK
ncbi:glucose-6-phosphate dehydrogenase [Saccharobesus litoralis]|uniref:Glucose-6-phosphate 1-dehydrogenase n=1 Tax=Saccharobesus litoralis TaxID=2172099 RepID=A0A2S0VUP8_9ALTE|nr:glucose-6-phosphate dehydrogenase [Saccharobesus litoralis]AWB67820.1 glucose-6-phosphate dehydrogenase [Saccharobesus litoralis]